MDMEDTKQEVPALESQFVVTVDGHRVSKNLSQNEAVKRVQHHKQGDVKETGTAEVKQVLLG